MTVNGLLVSPAAIAATNPFRLMMKPLSKEIVVNDPISVPQSAAMPAASAKAIRPVLRVGMPTSRAPRRLTAVARSALPSCVFSKKR